MLTRRTVLSGAAACAVASTAGVRPTRAKTHKGITFTVDDVEGGTKPLPQRSANEVVTKLLNSPDQKIESWSRNKTDLIHYDYPVIHPFLLALNTAYDQHYPLVLSPDMIWLLILQGFARHVNGHAETLRKKFVAHEGQIELTVIRNSFKRGNPDNDWPGVFDELSLAIREHVGASTHDMIVSQFSTTGPVEKAAMELAMLDTFQAYFKYGVSTVCGFPSITLEGTPADWRQLRTRAEELTKYELDWWVPNMLPHLDEFVRASENNPNTDFWCNFYKLANEGSGSEFIEGHIVDFFPYVGSLRVLIRNPLLGKSLTDNRIGFTASVAGSNLTSAPLTWHYWGQKIKMELVAGFIGSSQDRTTLAVRPEIGWVVREAAPTKPAEVSGSQASMDENE